MASTNKHDDSQNLGSLEIQIVCAEKLSSVDTSRGLPDPFVEMRVYLGDGNTKSFRKWRTRQVSKSQNPVWNEGCSLPIPADKELSARILGVIYDGDAFGRHRIGEFSFTIRDVLDSEKDFESIWFCVHSNAKPDARLGRVLCQVKFVSGKALESSYLYSQKNIDSLLQVLFVEDQWFSILSSTSSSRSDQLAEGLVTSTLALQCVEPFVYSLLQREVRPDVELSTLFRADSTCTKILRSLLFKTALPFAKSVLGAVVLIICEFPDLFDLEEKNPTENAHIQQRFFGVCLQLIESLDLRAENVPEVIRTVLSMLRQIVETLFPNSGPCTVGGFFFLRFLCPLLVSPETAKITEEPPKRKSRDALTNVSKVLQCLSNGTRLKAVTSYSSSFNAFIEKHSNRFVGVIGKLSGIPQPKTSDCWKNPYFSSQIQTREKRFTLSPEVLKLVVPQVDLFLRHIHNFSDRIVTFLQRDLQIFPDLSEQDVADSIEIVRTIARDLDSPNCGSTIFKLTNRNKICLQQGEIIWFESRKCVITINEKKFPARILVTNLSVSGEWRFFDCMKAEYFPLSATQTKEPETSDVRLEIESESIILSFSSKFEALRMWYTVQSMHQQAQKKGEQQGRQREGRNKFRTINFKSSSHERDPHLRQHEWNLLLNVSTSREYKPFDVICMKGEVPMGIGQVVQGGLGFVRSDLQTFMKIEENHAEKGCEGEERGTQSRGSGGSGGRLKKTGSPSKNCPKKRPTSSPSQKCIEVLFPGEVYGLISYVCGTPLQSTLAAGEKDTIVTSLDAEKLQSLFRKDKSMAIKFYCFVASSLARAWSSINDISTKCLGTGPNLHNLLVKEKQTLRSSPAVQRGPSSPRGSSPKSIRVTKRTQSPKIESRIPRSPRFFTKSIERVNTIDSKGFSPKLKLLYVPKGESEMPSSLDTDPNFSLEKGSFVKSKTRSTEEAERVLEDEPVEFEACLLRRTNSPIGKFYLSAGSALFLAHIFGRKIEVLVDFNEIRRKKTTISVVSGQRLQIKIGEIPFLFKMNDVRDFAELLNNRAIEGDNTGNNVAQIPNLQKLSPYMETMSSSDWDLFLASGTNCKRFKANEVLIVVGEKQCDLYQIMKGTVRCEKGGKVVRVLSEGDVFGEVGLLGWFLNGNEPPSLWTVVADSTEVEVLTLEGHFVSNLISRNAQLCTQFLAYLCWLLATRLSSFRFS